MARRTVVHAGTIYTIADDDVPRAELLPWAVLRTRIVDELTLEPPRVNATLTSSLALARPRVADGGICGLVARPRDVAHALTTPGAFTARITAPGYLDHDLSPAIEAARRAIAVVAPIGATAINVTPADPAPRQQFRPGRGVLLARTAPARTEQFTTVVDTGAVPAPGDVDLADGLPDGQPVGARTSGVPLVLPDQQLHRASVVRVRGRIQRVIGPNTLGPATGASLGIRGIWRDYPSCTTTAALTPDVCAIEPTARASHAAGAQVSTCTVTPIGGPRELRTGVPAGARTLTIAPGGGLNPAGGDLLRIGDPITREDEVVVSAGFDAASNPAAPVHVRLTRPTAHIHRAGAPVRDVAAALTPFSTIARQAITGDAVLFAAGLPSLPATTSFIAVDDGAAGAAIYRATQLPFTPDGVAFSHQVPLDAEGRFELPPIARVAQISLVVSHPAHALVQRDVALDYFGDTIVAIVLT